MDLGYRKGKDRLSDKLYYSTNVALKMVVKKTFSDVENSSKVFEIKIKLRNLRQVWMSLNISIS